MKAITYGTARLLYAAYLAAIFVTLAVLDVYLLIAVLATSVVFAIGEHFVEHQRARTSRGAAASRRAGRRTAVAQYTAGVAMALALVLGTPFLAAGAALTTLVLFAVGEHFVERRRLKHRRLATALELEGDATIGTGRSSLSRRD